MRAKSLILLTLALGCGLVASIGIRQVLARRNAEPTDPGQTQDILVAKKDILMGEQLTPAMVSIDSRPAAYIPAGALSSPDEVVGRRAKTLIPANTPVTDALLLGKGVGDQMASSGIPQGKRLATVKVEAQSAVGNLIRPGDWLDVLVHVKADPGRGIVKTATKTILQSIRVYAVNDMWDISSSSGEKSLTAKTISLIVSPEQAELVALAASLGDITLVMRGPDDKEIKVLAGRDPQELLGLSTPGGDAGGPTPDLANVLTGLIAPQPAPPGPPATPTTPATVAAAPEELKTFTVRVLAGSQVADMVLETSADPREPNPSGASPIWRVNAAKSKTWRNPTATGVPEAAIAAEPKPLDVESSSLGGLGSLLVAPSKD